MSSPNDAPSSIPASVAPPPRRPAGGRGGSRLLFWWYDLKYRVFHRERRPDDGERGLLVLQIDALSYAEFRRALELGYCPTLRSLLRDEGYKLRRWFCGLPSATPYCQAGIFHGENDGIPAFRFYDKQADRVITCNAPEGVQYIRDRIHSPGALAGGSSYVNLLDGDAQTVAFTVATRERLSVYRRLGGTRMALLLALHPIRVLRIFFQGFLEWLREEWERFHGELSRRTTHSEGLFPFIRILSNVVVRELQTMVILLDLYLGVPVIYSTFMQYDELAHHFGPSSFPALRDLRRTDKRIAELMRMIRTAAGREYDIVILSDHGMTPSASYRVAFGESLGTTVQRILAGDAERTGREPLRAMASYSDTSEYAAIGPDVLSTMAGATPVQHKGTRRALLRVREWLRSKYGLRDLLFPEKYHVAEQHDVVVTYSSCLALLYFTDDDARLELADIAGDRRRAMLYASLLEHPGIGLVATVVGPSVHLESREGRALLHDGELEVLGGANPLLPYGTERPLLRAVEKLVRQHNAGDLVLFGAYDGYEIISFDDQVGSHGAAGGAQLYPFIMGPPHLGLEDAVLEDASHLHAALFGKRRKREVVHTPAFGVEQQEQA